MFVPITDSPHLDPATELDSIDGTAVFLSPEDYSNWADMFAANPNALDYVLDANADFTTWGTFTQTSISGTSERRRTIRSAAGVMASGTLVDSWEINADNWILAWLVWDGGSVNCSLRGADNCLVHECTIINGVAPGLAYALRVRDCEQATVQRCLIGNFAPTGGDIIGVQIKPLRDGDPVVNNKVLDCELYDLVDGVQVTQNGNVDPTEPASYIIDGNDMYTTPAYRILSGEIENGIDVKAGDGATRSFITNNRIWGMPGGLASRGDGIVFHRYAVNCEISDNIIGDCVNGIIVLGWDDLSDVDRLIDWDRNIIYDCGTAFDPHNDCTITDNTAVRCPVLIDYGPGGVPGTRIGTPVITGTLQNTVPLSHHADDTGPGRCPYDPLLNASPAVGPIVYERRRFTGPEQVVVLAGVGTRGRFNNTEDHITISITRP